MSKFKLKSTVFILCAAQSSLAFASTTTTDAGTVTNSNTASTAASTIESASASSSSSVSATDSAPSVISDSAAGSVGDSSATLASDTAPSSISKSSAALTIHSAPSLANNISTSTSGTAATSAPGSNGNSPTELTNQQQKYGTGVSGAFNWLTDRGRVFVNAVGTRFGMEKIQYKVPTEENATASNQTDSATSDPNNGVKTDTAQASATTPTGSAQTTQTGTTVEGSDWVGVDKPDLDNKPNKTGKRIAEGIRDKVERFNKTTLLTADGTRQAKAKPKYDVHGSMPLTSGETGQGEIDRSNINKSDAKKAVAASQLRTALESLSSDNEAVHLLKSLKGIQLELVNSTFTLNHKRQPLLTYLAEMGWNLAVTELLALPVFQATHHLTPNWNNQIPIRAAAENFDASQKWTTNKISTLDAMIFSMHKTLTKEQIQGIGGDLIATLKLVQSASIFRDLSALMQKGELDFDVQPPTNELDNTLKNTVTAEHVQTAVASVTSSNDAETDSSASTSTVQTPPANTLTVNTSTTETNTDLSKPDAKTESPVASSQTESGVIAKDSALAVTSEEDTSASKEDSNHPKAFHTSLLNAKNDLEAVEVLLNLRPEDSGIINETVQKDLTVVEFGMTKGWVNFVAGVIDHQNFDPEKAPTALFTAVKTKMASVIPALIEKYGVDKKDSTGKISIVVAADEAKKAATDCRKVISTLIMELDKTDRRPALKGMRYDLLAAQKTLNGIGVLRDLARKLFDIRQSASLLDDKETKPNKN